MTICPLCCEGHLPDVNIPGVIWADNALTYNLNFIARFGKKEGRFVEICLRFWPKIVSYQRCIYALWYDEDEPLDCRNLLSVHACHIREKLAAAGLEIMGCNYLGYRFMLPAELALLPVTRKHRRHVDIPPNLHEMAGLHL